MAIDLVNIDIAFGKRLHNYGPSRCLMGNSMISMAFFNSYVKLPEGSYGNDPYIVR